MHTILRSVVDTFIGLGQIGTFLAAKLAAARGHALDNSDTLMAAIGLTSLIFSTLSSIGLCVYRNRLRQVQLWAKHAIAHGKTEQRLQSALISGFDEAFVILDPPIDCGERGMSRLQECLAGPDADALAAAIQTLCHADGEFDLDARTAEGHIASVRGRRVDGTKVVYLRLRPSTPAYMEVLQSQTLPVWIRTSDLRLRWANNAFLAVTASKSLDNAISENLCLDQAELELLDAARKGAHIIEMRRPVTLFGERRILAFTIRALSDGDIMCMAIDVGAAAPQSNMNAERREALSQFVNGLTSAVAIFDSTRRLVTHNANYARLWSLSERWLDTGPLADEILDRLRETRHLPERRNFSSWKQDHLQAFVKADTHFEELWHLPSGASVRVMMDSIPGGGTIVLIDDISDRLRLESAYNLLTQVHIATLNAFDEGLAIFGTDGRLKTHNESFAKLWSLQDQDLQHQPHVSSLIGASERVFGPCGIWDILLTAISEIEAPKALDGVTVRRADGVKITLSISRLPDGATMARYTKSPGRDQHSIAA